MQKRRWMIGLTVFVMAGILLFMQGTSFAEPVVQEEEQQWEYKQISGNYSIDLSNTGHPGKFVYSHEMLLGNSTILSGDLCKASVALAVGAYDCSSGSDNTVDTMLKGMGYTEINTYNYNNTAIIDNDTVGAKIGIANDVNGKRIVCVAVRGTHGTGEWISDFHLQDASEPGGGEDHYGFKKAANALYARLQEIIGSNPTNTILWFTGHSRGAAVANILAARYTKEIGKSNVFAYTFACPAVSKKEGVGLAGYENIHNYFNSGDAIPAVPLKEWGYKRYGKDEAPMNVNSFPTFQMNHLREYGEFNSSAYWTMSYVDIIKEFFPEPEDLRTPGGRLSTALLCWYLGGHNLNEIPEVLAHYGKEMLGDDETIEMLEDRLTDISVEDVLDEILGVRADLILYSEFLVGALNDTGSYTEEEFQTFVSNQWPMMNGIEKATGVKIQTQQDMVIALSRIDIMMAAPFIDADTFDHFEKVMAAIMDITSDGYGNPSPLSRIAYGHAGSSYVMLVDTKYLGYRAHMNSYESETVTVPSCVKTIGYECFSGSNIKNLIGADHLVYVSESAFKDCLQLESIEFSEIRSFESNVFKSCTALTNVDMGEAVETIKLHAFEDCSALEELYIPDSVKDIELNGVDYTQAGAHYGPFVGCTGLKRISIGGINKITQSMLKTGSQALESLTIRGSVQEIGDYAFESAGAYNGTAAETTTERFYTTNPINYNEAPIGYYAIHNGYENETDHECALIIEEGVRKIGRAAFYKCRMFTSVSIPSTVTTIGELAFLQCSGLTTANAGGASVIEKYTFSGCTGLKSFDFGNTVQTIRLHAFINCSSLETLYIPDSVTQIDIQGSFDTSESHYGPFNGCTGVKEISIGGVRILQPSMLKTGSTVLEKLTIRGTVKTIGYGAFNSLGGYTSTSKDTFNDRVTGSDLFVTGNGYSFETEKPVQLIIEPGVEKIERAAFAGCTVFEEVNLPSTVTTIEHEAFYKCTNLKTANAGGAKVINQYTFAQCSSLESFDFGETVQVICLRSFINCSSLEKLYIPDSVTRIDISGSFDTSEPHFGPFNGCTGLKEISIGGVETLQPSMLKTGSTVLEKLTIRGTVKTVSYGAFNSLNGYTGVSKDTYNDRLTGSNLYVTGNGYSFETDKPVELIIEPGVQRIDRSAFAGCTVFEEINLPSTVTIIEHEAFAYCTNLKKANVGGATSVNQYTFYKCTGLEEIDLGNVQSIWLYAFTDCTSLEELYIPDSVSQIAYSGAYNKSENHYGPFSGCTGLKRISVGGLNILQHSMLKTGSQVLERLTIRGTVKKIGYGAFNSINGYTRNEADSVNSGTHSEPLYTTGNGYAFMTGQPAELVIEEGVQEIQWAAFKGCKMFGSVTLPASLTYIHTEAFGKCRDGLIIYGHNGSLAQTYAGNNGIRFVSLETTYPEPDFTVPGELTTIEEEAFCGNAFMSVQLSAETNQIGSRAFADNETLQAVLIPNKDIEIADDAFENSAMVTLYGPEDSKAREYGLRNRIPFIAVQDPE